jgi:phytoene desaturase
MERPMNQATKPSHAVVVGAGFGGLAAAVRLRARGYKVTVVDALDQPGGRARVFRQDGFTFDAGPTVITAPYLIDELFELLGEDARDAITFLPVDPFYRVEFHQSQGGGSFDYVGEEDRLLEQIKRFEPRDVDGYLRMAQHMRRIFEVGYTGLADRPFGRFSDMLKVLPQMMQLESYRTVYGLASKYLRDDRLRQVFTFQPLLVGGNPFTTTSIYCMIHWLERKWGCHFAQGGTTAIVHALVRLLQRHDVEVRCNAPVARIEVQNGKASAVHLEDGTTIAADLVVSNADPSMTYSKMIAPEHRKKHTDSQVKRVRGSMGLFVAYFGTNKTFPDLKHHTIVLGPRYRGLLDDIFHKRTLADDFSLYLHAPTRTDASMAPPGHEAFYVLSPVPNLQGNGAKVDWAAEHTRYFDKIVGALDAYAPGLSSSIVTKTSIDPRDFQSAYRTMHGAAFGPEPVLTQSAWFRYHNRSPDVGNLFFVGAGTHPGAGVPGVLSSAKVLDRIVDAPDRAMPLALPSSSRRAA